MTHFPSHADPLTEAAPPASPSGSPARDLLRQLRPWRPSLTHAMDALTNQGRWGPSTATRDPIAPAYRPPATAEKRIASAAS